MTRYLINLLAYMLICLVLMIGQLSFIPMVLASVDDTKGPVKIGSYLAPKLIEKDGAGLFNQLNDAVFMEMNKKIELNLSSVNRVRRDLKNGQLDSYFPELWENLPGEKTQYVVSRPIFYKRVILFTLKRSGLTKLSDFKNKLLGAVEGFSYGKEIKSNPHLTLSFQKDDITNVKLLLNGRFSGILGGFPGTVMAVKANNRISEIHYDLDKPVAILESFYVCKNNPNGVKLCNSINKAIESLLRKGVLELNEKTGFSRFNPQK